MLSFEPIEFRNVEIPLELLRREHLFDRPILLLAGVLAHLAPVDARLVVVAAAASLGENGAELLGLLVAQGQDLLPGGDVAGELGLAPLPALGGHEAFELILLLGAEELDDAVARLLL